MKQFKAMKFWIGDNPELSKKVQEILFGAGYHWYSGSTEQKTEPRYIRTEPNGTMYHGCTSAYYVEAYGEAIDISWMLAEKETISIGDKKYYKDELETALKNINPI